MERFVDVILMARHSNAVAAGSTVITPSAGIDCESNNGCLFVVCWGAIVAAGVQSVEVHASNDDGVGDAYAIVTGSNIAVADTADNKITYVDVRRPPKRYMKCIVNRATQDSTVDAILAFCYDPRRRAVTQPATVSGGSKV